MLCVAIAFIALVFPLCARGKYFLGKGGGFRLIKISRVCLVAKAREGCEILCSENIMLPPIIQ